MINNQAERTCDKCGNKYQLNSREIPKISISMKVDIDDLHTRDLIITPDYCYSCFMYISFNFGKFTLYKLQKLGIYNNPNISR